MAEREGDRRRFILETAARLLREHGPAKTTMADIAREADMAVGTVYLEFSSKEDIVAELSSRAHARVLAAMENAAAEKRAAPDKLTAAFVARVSTFIDLEKEGRYSCQLLDCSAATKLKRMKAEAVRAANQRFREQEQTFFRALLELGIEEGSYARIDAERTAALVQRVLATLTPPALFESAPHEAMRCAMALASLLNDGLVVRDPAGDLPRPRTRPR
jgi:AcrR family transcriptional regulator